MVVGTGVVCFLISSFAETDSDSRRNCPAARQNGPSFPLGIDFRFLRGWWLNFLVSLRREYIHRRAKGSRWVLGVVCDMRETEESQKVAQAR